MGHVTTRRLVLVVALVAGLVGASGATTALAGRPARVEAAAAAKKKKPGATAAQSKALVDALGLRKSAIKKCVKALEKSDAEQEQSGPNALLPDPVIAIKLFGSCAGTTDETLFFIKLGAVPATGGPAYEWGLGLALDGQPQSVPVPDAIAGFGRVALSHEYFLEPTGEFLSLDPANNYANVATGASALVVDVFAVFRVPDSELGAGTYYLQTFARDGNTEDSPAGFVMVMGELDA